MEPAFNDTNVVAWYCRPYITWLWLRGGLAAIPSNVFGFWYCPIPIITWMVSRSVGALILVLILFAVNTLIYYPFFKVYDHMQSTEEVKAA